MNDEERKTSFWPSVYWRKCKVLIRNHQILLIRFAPRSSPLALFGRQCHQRCRGQMRLCGTAGQCSVQCSVQCIVYTMLQRGGELYSASYSAVYSAVYSAQYTLRDKRVVQCTLYCSVQCTLRTVGNCSVQCTLWDREVCTVPHTGGQYSVVQCRTWKYSAVKVIIVQCSTVECSTLYSVRQSLLSFSISPVSPGGLKVPLYTLHCFTSFTSFTSWGLPLVKLSPWEERDGADQMAALPLTE